MNQSLVPDFFLNLVNSPKHLMLVLSKIIKKGLSKILKTYNFFFHEPTPYFRKLLRKTKVVISIVLGFQVCSKIFFSQRSTARPILMF